MNLATGDPRRRLGPVGLPSSRLARSACIHKTPHICSSRRCCGIFVAVSSRSSPPILLEGRNRFFQGTAIKIRGLGSITVPTRLRDRNYGLAIERPVYKERYPVLDLIYIVEESLASAASDKEGASYTPNFTIPGQDTPITTAKQSYSGVALTAAGVATSLLIPFLPFSLIAGATAAVAGAAGRKRPSGASCILAHVAFGPRKGASSLVIAPGRSGRSRRPRSRRRPAGSGPRRRRYCWQRPSAPQRSGARRRRR